MNKTEKMREIFFATKFLIFVMVFVGLFSIMHKVFLVKNENVYNYINFIRQPENSVDILILGSSHSADGIDAKRVDSIMQNEYGMKTNTFNMSVTGMRLEQIQYRWKEAIKTQKPKVLVIETFSCAPQSTGTNESINRWALDYMPLSKEKVDYINTEISENLQTSFMIPFIKYHSRWKELTKEDWEILSSKKIFDKSKEQGIKAPDKPEFSGTEDSYFEQDFSMITKETALSPKYQKYIQEILQSCREIGCKVIFLCIPYKVQADFYAEELVKYNNYLERLYVNNEDVFIYDMQKEVQSLGWGYQQMTDEGHVNNLGREVVNRELAVKLQGILEE